MNVAVIGASDKKDRYSYKAVMLLKEKGHNVFPIHKRVTEIDGIKVYKSISDISEKLDTVSMYISQKFSQGIIDEILMACPKRIIFNPGAENPDLREKADQRGMLTVEACTLVMLKTGQF